MSTSASATGKNKITNDDEKQVGRIKFSKPGANKAVLGITLVQGNTYEFNKTEVFLESTTIFSLSEVFDKFEEVLLACAATANVSKWIIWNAIALTCIQNGTAREKVSKTMFVYVNELEGVTNAKYGITSDGVIDVATVLREVQEWIKSKYKDIKQDQTSANGGKLFIRCYANQIVRYIFDSNLDSSHIIKVAKKTGITNPKLSVLSNPAISDIYQLSKKDAKCHLMIMANFMKRSRSGKSNKDVLGQEVNKKDIFISLATRVYISHPEIGVMNNSDIEKIWEEGAVPEEKDCDLESQIIYERGTTTLAALLSRFMSTSPKSTV